MKGGGFAVRFRGSVALDVLVDGDAAGRPLLVLAHGANGGPRHRLLDAVVPLLARGGVTVVRFPFPFHAEGRRSPNSDTVLAEALETVWAAVASRFEGRPLYLGGKSLGARIAAAHSPRLAPQPGGLVYLGYPLHAPGRQAQVLPAALAGFRLPQLFIQGTRDAFGTPEELGGLLGSCGRRVRILPIQGGDHSLRCAVDQDGGIAETVATAVAGWIGKNQSGS